MPTLLVSAWTLPAARELADAARKNRWSVASFLEDAPLVKPDRVVYYGGSDTALAAADQYQIALLEPPLDLLAKLGPAFRSRAVEYAHFRDLSRLHAPTFVKPADALNKCFDAGIYANVASIRDAHKISDNTPVLLSEPVEWLAEYRCFILNGKVAAYSPYLSYGRPVWQAFGKGGEKAGESKSVLAFCERLLSKSGYTFPPAVVVDVGLIEERGWAVVEFNPAWCAGILGADPQRVLSVLERACQDRKSVSADDRRWLIESRDHA